MNEIVQKEEIVRIINDKLVIDTGTDWTAVIALVFSVLSTIGILWWQNYLRKKDIELQQWNALYPHRLEFYTNFFKTYNQFVNYTETSFEVKLPNRVGTSQERVFNTKELLSIIQKFYNFCEEAKILFDKDISDLVCNVYGIIQGLGYQPLSNIGETLQDLSTEISSVENEEEYTVVKEKLLSIQSQLLDLKWNTDLKEKFIQVLKLEGNKDE